jgi:FAD binding domain
MQKNTALDFVDGNAIPDFHDISEGAASGGRSVCAAPYDGRRLGQRIVDLKPPLELIAPFGMGIAAGADLRHFFSATRTCASFWHVSKRVLQHFADLLRYGRGMQLVAGNALVGRLLKSADDCGVRILTVTPARELTRDTDGSVTGLITRDGQRITARRDVVLAAGGFPHDPKRKAAMFPHAPTGSEHFSAASRGNTGDGLRLGETAGGTVRQDLSHAGAWAPVSLVAEADGGTGHFPHLAERAKPGLIMVREDGQRFGNEADSYHDLMQALFAATPPGETPACWMIADHAFQRRYGLGRARPRPFPLRHWIANGYLKRSQTIPGLGLICGIDPAGLEATIARVNADAAMGQDSAYGRGSSAYNRIQGDPEQKPNPCVLCRADRPREPRHFCGAGYGYQRPRPRFQRRTGARPLCRGQ